MKGLLFFLSGAAVALTQQASVHDAAGSNRIRLSSKHQPLMDESLCKFRADISAYLE
jgi:hypothetical protein